MIPSGQEVGWLDSSKAYAMVKFCCKRKEYYRGPVVRKHTSLEKVKDHTKLKIKLFLT